MKKKVKSKSKPGGEEYAWRLIMKARSEKEWEQAIKLIGDPDTRVHVACIIWWDCLHLETYLDKYKRDRQDRKRTTPEELKAALMKVGYPECAANRRSEALVCEREMQRQPRLS